VPSSADVAMNGSDSMKHECAGGSGRRDVNAAATGVVLTPIASESPAARLGRGAAWQ